MSPSQRRLLVGIVALALLLRLGWSTGRPTGDASLAALPDQTEYLALGRSIISEHRYALYDARFHDTVYAYRTPGYPLLIASCGGSVRIVRIAQAMLDASTVLATFLLARRWLPVGASLFAAAIVAADPFLVYFTGLLLSETLFAALLIWSLYLLGHRHLAARTAAFLLLAIGVLVRPAAAWLPAALAVVLVFVDNGCGGDGAARWPSWTVLIIMLAALTLVLTPWAIRNQLVLGQPVLTGTNGGITLYDGFQPNATGGSDQLFVASLPELQQMNELGRNDYLTHKAIAAIKSSPARDLQLALAKLARTWSPMPLSSEYGRPAYRAIGLAFYGPLFLLTIVGLLRANLPIRAVILLLLPIAYFSAVHAMTVGSLRYRVPLDPILAVLAASLAKRFAVRKERLARQAANARELVV